MLKIEKRPGRKNYRVRGRLKVWRGGRLISVDIDKSTGTHRRGDAEIFRQQIEETARQQSLTGKPKAVTFGEAAARYMEAGGERRFLTRPLDYYEDLPVDEITDDMIFDDGLRAYPGVLPDTIRRNWDVPIRAVLNFQKAPKRRKQTSGRRTVFFTPAEAEALIAAYMASDAPERAGHSAAWGKALVTFLIGQGTRTGETIALCSEWALLDYGKIIIPGEVTKNGAEKIITLIPRVTETLRALPNIDEPGPIFRRSDGTPFVIKPKGHGGYIRTAFGNAVEAIGLDRTVYTPHVCRHTFATWSYSQHKDILRLKREGGWKSDEAERYVQLASDELAAEALAHNWAFIGPKPDPAEHLRVVSK